MKIVPVDVAHKNFRKKMMGFDEDEVTLFLSKVAESMDQLIREVNQLKESLREKEMQMLEYRDRDKVLKDTITTAQQMSERIVREAERESKLIVNDANHKAEIINKDARDGLKNLYREISDLKRNKIQFEANLRALIQSHMSLMENRDQIFTTGALEGVEFISPER